MANISDKEMAVAKVYGASMLELAEAAGEADSLLAELRDLGNYLARNADFENFLISPMVDTQSRAQALEAILRGRASDLLVDSLQVLNRKERLGVLRAIVECYRLAHEELRGQIDVHVSTAIPLSPALRELLGKVASEYTGKQAVLVETVDEAIIGGMVIHAGDEKFDASVASRLRRLGGAFAERATHEIHGEKSYVTTT
ncbi:MAG: ATP synthase F1 subunit delta [Planctomycetes bacterium]|nr:ATP synthase F1 subunit delta [Planctomycetota bacterium]